ncbi:MAG: NAD-dependent epimerase/dehydratase family protein [Bacteroidota bacterium]
MILVTGATGLLGTELIKQLSAQNKKVKALYRSTSPTYTHPSVQWVEGDILDTVFLEEIMEEIDTVYHCAAVVSFSPKDVAILYKINVEGTANVVNACLNFGIKKLVHVSSVASLGRMPNSAVIDENTVWNSGDKNSEYAKSKHNGEMEVWRGIAEGLDAVIVNPSIILGGGNWNTGSTKIFKTIYDEFAWYSTGINGFVDVVDVASAMIYLMDSDIKNQRFIVNADNLEYKQIFYTIATTWNKKPPYKKVTPLIASIVWRLEKLKSMFGDKAPLITKETVTTAMEQYFYNNEKLLKALPDFKYQSIDNTVGRICNELTIKYNLK